MRKILGLRSGLRLREHYCGPYSSKSKRLRCVLLGGSTGVCYSGLVQVDIDQALSGIDKLLKSQELTFAFVGVAPVIAITYVFGGVLMRVWEGSRGIGKYGGRHRRTIAWLVMRFVNFSASPQCTLDPMRQADRTSVDLPTALSRSC